MPQGMLPTIEFDLDGRSFLGLNGGLQFTFSEAIIIHCKDQTEVAAIGTRSPPVAIRRHIRPALASLRRAYRAHGLR